MARLIRSAQDVLTLLSQEGIYMDDLRPEMTHPDHWRRFATGERGRGVAAAAPGRAASSGRHSSAKRSGRIGEGMGSSSGWPRGPHWKRRCG